MSSSENCLDIDFAHFSVGFPVFVVVDWKLFLIFFGYGGHWKYLLPIYHLLITFA